MKVWSVYIMAAPLRDGFSFFKVGITSNIPKRLSSVQCGCPLKITTLWAITLWGNGSAQNLESLLHEKLSAYRTHGEWFGMETDNEAHKSAMRGAMDFAVEYTRQVRDGGWRKYSINEIREMIRDLGCEVQEVTRSRRATEKARAMALMATTGRRIL